VAIYHYQMKTVSRSAGRSATAAAAYRSGQAITDERTGQVFDYSKRSGVMLAEVVMPDGQPAEREALWNAAEAAEKRCNSVVAREIVVALPHELRRDQQETLVKDYAQGLSERTGWAVDVAIHAPGKEGDIRNTHAHLLCSTRRVDRDASGLPVMGSKTREWDQRATGSELIRTERSEWERCVNQALEKAYRVERVDCRSHAEKGTGMEPQIHLGVAVTGMERKGIQTERGNQHREIAAHNAQVVDLDKARAEREAVQAWEQKLDAMRRMPFEALQKERERYRPVSVEKLIDADPLVKVEETHRAATEAQYHRWQEEAKDRRYDLQRNARSQSEYQEAHPVRSWLHAQGIRSDASLKGLEKQAEKLVKERESAESAAAIYKESCKKAVEDVERYRKLALSGAVRENSRQRERFLEVERVYQPRQEQALALKREQEQQREKERQQERERGGGGRYMGR
jgi:Tfp pilus assembly protein PilV